MRSARELDHRPLNADDADANDTEESAWRHKRNWAVGLTGVCLISYLVVAHRANGLEESGIASGPSAYYSARNFVNTLERDVGLSVEASFISQCETWGTDPGNALPTFHSRSELENSKWAPYFKRMYGEIPTTRYPICMTSFWFLNKDALQEFGLEPDTNTHDCWGKPGDVYLYNNEYQPPWSTWIWHPPPFGINGQGLPGDTWVEVNHLGQSRESLGSWFLFSAGSGIWLNTGKTIVFGDHQPAHKKFCGSSNRGSPCFGNKGDRLMVPPAADQGYDTIQFIAHPDPTWMCNPGKGKWWHKGWVNIEIVTTKLHGSGACGQTPGAFRAGWNAEHVCDCDQSQPWLNCKGFGSVANGRVPTCASCGGEDR